MKIIVTKMTVFYVVFEFLGMQNSRAYCLAWDMNGLADLSTSRSVYCLVKQ